jgi:hypothetical protein
MFGDLFTALALRSRLKRAQAAGTNVCLFYKNGAEDIVRLIDVGWFTLRIDVLADDEQTWIARSVVKLFDIDGFNEKSTRRARAALMATDEILSGPNGPAIPVYSYDFDDDFDE